jgi:hypothetical protein
LGKDVIAVRKLLMQWIEEYVQHGGGHADLLLEWIGGRDRPARRSLPHSPRSTTKAPVIAHS